MQLEAEESFFIPRLSLFVMVLDQCMHSDYISFVEFFDNSPGKAGRPSGVFY
jgi:hypothetical protein